MQIILPELGQDIEKAVVACWHYRVGDDIKEGDDVVELVTDKASFNVSASSSGKLTNILVAEGQEATIGQPLALIE